MLLEASEENTESKEHGGGRIVWSVRYALEGEEDNVSLSGPFQSNQQPPQPQLHHHHHNNAGNGDRKKLQAHLEIQKDDIQAVLPISKVSVVPRDVYTVCYGFMGGERENADVCIALSFGW